MFFLASTQTIVIVCVIALVGAIAAFYISRMMKGKLEVALPKNGYNTGEPVVGKVTLTTKKSLALRRFYVALIGYQVTEHRDKNGSNRTRRDEIFRNEFNLLEAQTIPGGFQQTFDFSLATPGRSSAADAYPSDTGESDIQKAIVSTVGTAVQAMGAMGMFRSHSGRYEWKVEARADLPGVDLAKSQAVRVSMI